jgi:class 3 adenylate cyclase
MSRKAPEIYLKPAETITFGGFVFLTKSRELRTVEGKAVGLRSQSAEVLSVFAARPGEIMSKDALMQAVWPDTFVTDDSLTQCIADIRRALGDDTRAIVETLPKRGYRLNADRVQRRLATVLAADAAGYSRLIGRDEEGTLATLRAHRQIIDRLIEQHGGRAFGSAGDSVIAEFTSPVEAVRCATEIQFEVDRRNAGVPEPNRLRFRIGINLGDVVVEGGNLMGDAVNVAARLEALSRPGGICISDAVYTHAHDRLSLVFVDLGEYKVKNIARPVRAYRVSLASEEQARSPFRGLEVFESENADLFFGRARAIAACTERLEQQAAGGKSFLLIYGMSGSGKSSLLRAGLLPSITRPGAIAGIEFWRRCLIRPSEGPDPVA